MKALFFLTKLMGCVALLLITLPLFVPFSPKMPAFGVDPSWALGLNQAVAEGLIFGKDIIFTLGPYSSIYTKLYHPATDTMMLWGSLYLGASYGLALMLLANQASRAWILALGAFLLTFVYAKDSLFFSYPLLLGIIIVRYDMVGLRIHPVVFGLLCAPLGLYPLIKGSMLLLCGLIVLLCALLFMYGRRIIFLGLVLVIPIVSFYLFWIASGQQGRAIPQYILHSLEMVFSFSEAMSTEGSSNEALLYGAASLLLLALIIKEQLASVHRCFLLGLFFIFLFLSFKAGFTRPNGHVLISSTSLFIAALLLPHCLRSRWVLPVVGLSALSSLYVIGQNTSINPVRNLYSTYSAAWFGAVNRIQNPEWLSKNFRLTMDVLQTQAGLPKVLGKTDIYSYGQTELIASGNHWSPRPIFQSYSTFNAGFSRNNQEHLLGAQSPDSVFFAVQPIDNRMPSLEDGASWITLLSHYEPKSQLPNWLLLQKKVTTPTQALNSKYLRGHHKLGDEVVLSEYQRPLFAKILIKPTLLGRITQFLFKLETLYIQVRTADGVLHVYRFIPAMAQSYFLLSPLIETTTEFATLYEKREVPAQQQVVSYVILPKGNKHSWFWQIRYDSQVFSQ